VVAGIRGCVEAERRVRRLPPHSRADIAKGSADVNGTGDDGVQEQISAPGVPPRAEAFATWVQELLRRGVITRFDWVELVEPHAVVIHHGALRGCSGEESVLSRTTSLEMKLKMLELGLPLAPPLCRYPPHRASDWLADDGRVVCGVCHPPPTAALVVARISDGRRDPGTPK
jgi:hypothetical protein